VLDEVLCVAPLDLQLAREALVGVLGGVELAHHVAVGGDRLGEPEAEPMSDVAHAVLDRLHRELRDVEVAGCHALVEAVLGMRRPVLIQPVLHTRVGAEHPVNLTPGLTGWEWARSERAVGYESS
jgi:hypothetical protein